MGSAGSISGLDTAEKNVLPLPGVESCHPNGAEPSARFTGLLNYIETVGFPTATR
jgi:hypothetical protein